MSVRLQDVIVTVWSDSLEQKQEQQYRIDRRAVALCLESPNFSEKEKQQLKAASERAASNKAAGRMYDVPTEVLAITQTKALFLGDRYLRLHHQALVSEREEDRKTTQLGSPWETVYQCLTHKLAGIRFTRKELAEYAGRCKLGAFDGGSELTDGIEELNRSGYAAELVAELCRKHPVDAERMGLPAMSRAADDPPSNQPAELSGEAKALALLVQHPDWTDTEIAAAVTCSRTTLYDWPKFKAARQQAKQTGRLPRGSKDRESGRIEAIDDEVARPTADS